MLRPQPCVSFRTTAVLAAVKKNTHTKASNAGLTLSMSSLLLLEVQELMSFCYWFVLMPQNRRIYQMLSVLSAITAALSAFEHRRLWFVIFFFFQIKSISQLRLCARNNILQYFKAIFLQYKHIPVCFFFGNIYYIPVQV